MLTPDQVAIGANVVDKLTLNEQRALQDPARAVDNARFATVLKSRLPENKEVSLSVRPDVQYLSLVRILSALKGIGIDRVSIDLGERTSNVAIGPKPRDQGLLILLVRDGMSIKAPGGNVAPGCRVPGPGLAIPRVGEDYDYRALSECLARLIAATGAPSLGNVVATANPDVPFQNLIDAARAIEQAGARLVGLRLPT